ncbi:MAG: right-handed parallel beta-helix repeat-containing protein [Thermoguttaceae bacterium]
MTRFLLSLFCFILFISPLFAQETIRVAPGESIDAALKESREKKIKTIVLEEGVHRIESPLILLSEDSCLKIFGPGVISGGKVITGWKPFKNGIWCADVPAVRDGKWSFRQIYVNGELRFRAKTPNEGFYRVAGCPEGTPKTVGYHTDCQSFEFTPGDIKADWKNIDDAEVVVYYFWSDNHLPIESIDTEKSVVKFKYKGGKTFTDDFSEDGARYVVENVFEALDEPGEWYLDKKEGKIYYLPKSGEKMDESEVIAPFATELVRFEGDPANRKWVENVRFDNVSFQHCNFNFPAGKVNDSQGSSEITAAVNLTGAKNCMFIRCTFSCLGTYAIDLKSGCSNNVVVKSILTQLSAGGIRIDGGSAGVNPLFQTKNNDISENEISYYGLQYPSAVGVLVKNSGGNLVSQNNIHHGYYTGVSLGWVWGYSRSIARDNIVERNHIHNIGQGLLSDMGAVYTLGPSPGTVIRNNLIHDVNSHHYGGWGIYNDEGSTGILVEKNIVYNTKFAGYDMHYGKEITIRNNIFALGKMDQINRTRGEDHPSIYFENNIVYWKEGKLFSGNWKDREYAYYVNPSRKEQPKYTHNFESNWNIFYNPDLKVENVKFDEGTLEEWQKRGYDVNSIYADPMFVNPDKFDFRLKPDSPAFKLGFEEIDMDVPGMSVPE